MQRRIRWIAEGGRLVACVFLAVALTPAIDAAWGREPLDLFERRIRPLLIEHCYECHSEQSDPPAGGLRLDTRDAARRGGASGPAIVPGQVEQSRLIRALRYRDETLQMPPDGKLPDDVIRDFEAWIADGAADPRADDETPAAPREAVSDTEERHWAFQPLQAATPPLGSHGEHADPIDRFVAAKRAEVGLEPAPPADIRSRVRRLYFDLTGLPPSPSDVSALARDPSPEAWARLVDRLLSTRAFAEHWARHWLDVVRYADSNGNDFNATYHDAWRYRNYVIDSFASDKPFDRFVREQIAGDLMPFQNDAQRSEQLVATTFLTLGPKMLSERDKLKLKLDVVDEQIDAYGKAFLGLSLGCARCHDHKFDPIPATNYYALAGIFWNAETLDGEIQQYVSDWIRRDLPISDEHARQLAEYRRKTETLQTQIDEVEDRRREVQALVDRATLKHEGLIVDNGEAELKGEWIESQSVKRFVGRNYLHDGDRAKGDKSVTFFATISRPGRYELFIGYTPGENRASNVPIEIHHQSGTQRLQLDQRRSPDVDSLFQPLGVYSFAEGTQPVVVVSNAGTDGYVVADAIQLVPIDRDDEDAERDRQAELDRARLNDLRSLLTQLRDRSRRLKDELEHVKRLAPPAPAQAMSVREVQRPVDIEVRLRGVPSETGDLVPRGFLTLWDDQPTTLSDPGQSGRLELADWTTTVARPLVARVLANRVWHHLLGRGIVASCDDFGTAGDPPTHAELLDYLAMELIEHGWSVKYLIRRIVLSQTYQMEVAADERNMLDDPDNLWLSGARRKRLTAEQQRDAILSLAGMLDHRTAQSPVAHLGRLVNNNTANDAGFVPQQSLLRAIYLPVVRNELPELLVSFDFADPDRVVGRREETNVPAQMLLLLNHPLIRQAAERIARGIADEPDDLTRLSRLYQLVLQREPLPVEILRDQAFLTAASAHVGESTDGATFAWTQLCHALLASTEFRYLD